MLENPSINIKIIVGSTREGRFSDRAASWINTEMSKQSGVTTEILDLRDYAMPFFNESMSPAYIQEPYTHEAVARFTKKIHEGDGYIMVTPEYNHSTSGVLKNAVDWVYKEWNNKAVAFVSYGSVGGARAIEQLRLIAIELQMAPIRAAVHIPGERYFPVAFGKASEEELFASMHDSATTMTAQLLWWTIALKKARSGL
jgi:NAD(P)H-dependent FMN reductase